MNVRTTVIIPTLNEATTIHSTLEDLFTRHPPHEVLVVDGGSTDETVRLASEWTRVISSEKGRARQLNRGAETATGDIFLFLHADTRLPEGGLEKIRKAVESGREAGRFRMQFDKDNWLLRFYSLYTRFQFFSYGDQGFFVRRELFQELGGFREEVPFEDIDFYQRLRRKTRPVILPDCVTTSARRFSQGGFVRQKLINLWLVGLYYMGGDVASMKTKFYPEVR